MGLRPSRLVSRINTCVSERLPWLNKAAFVGKGKLDVTPEGTFVVYECFKVYYVSERLKFTIYVWYLSIYLLISQTQKSNRIICIKY